MGGDGKSPEAMDVVDDVARLAGQRVRGGRHVEREQMAAGGADLDRVDAQDAVAVRGRLGLRGRIAMVGDDDELQSGLRRRGRDVVDAAVAVGPIGVDVEHARDGAVGPGIRKNQLCGLNREGDEDGNGDRDNRRCR